jgi:hypothetical protein
MKSSLASVQLVTSSVGGSGDSAGAAPLLQPTSDMRRRKEIGGRRLLITGSPIR